MGVRSTRSMVIVAMVVVVMGSAGPAGAVGPCWISPVVGVVADPFREPACPWCPGNRGLEYEVVEGGPVRAVAGGTVTYSGQIAGERYLVVELASGWKLTYGRIASTSLTTGDAVVAGAVVGRTATTFHFGLRIDDRYVDPAPFLGVEVRRRRLLPTDGRPPRPAPAAAPRCADDR